MKSLHPVVVASVTIVAFAFAGVPFLAGASPRAFDTLPVQESARLAASDAAAYDGFGLSVSVSGETAAVGSPLDDDGASGAGSVYVFVRGGTVWTEQQKLTAGDAEQNDELGFCVAIDGDTIVAGSRFDDDGGSDSGAAYVFVRQGTTWSQQQKLTAADASAGDRFGHSVDVWGDWIVVGAHTTDDACPGMSWCDSGSAYVFHRIGTTWTEHDELTAGDAAQDDQFGAAVAIFDDLAVVGSANDDDAGNASGSAYVFERVGSTWVEQEKLTASDAVELDRFGLSVAIEAETVLVGKSGTKPTGPSDGSVYVYVRRGTVWNEQQKLTPSDVAQGKGFGGSVSISGNVAVVGDSIDDDACVADLNCNSGAAYVFSRSGTTWSELWKLKASDASSGDALGVDVCIDGDTVVAGAAGDDDDGDSSGSAYVFSAPDPQITTYCTAKSTSQGCAPFLGVAGSGLPSLTGTVSFLVRGHDHLPGGAGLLVYGFQKADLGFHGGKLCVKSPVRTAGKAAKSGLPAACVGPSTVGFLTTDFNLRIQSGVDPLLTSGQKVFAQWLQRDSANTIGGFSDNLSDGIRFTIGP